MYNMIIHNMNNINGFEISLLGFLHEKPMHGYDLHRKVTDLKGFGGVWRLKIGKLYAMLNKLHDAGFVSVENTQSGNRPVRNEYFITKEGESVFHKWLISPVLHGREFRHHFFLKFYFALLHSRENALNLLAAQKTECQTWLSKFHPNIDRSIDNSLFFSEFVTQYRLKQIKSDLEWLDWAEKTIIQEAK